MSNFGAVLDACVLVPAAVRDTLLRAAEAGLYRPFWSHDILAEVERAITRLLERKGHADALTKAQRVLAEIRAHFPEATITGHEQLIEAMTNDPGDRHVLAVGVASQAQAIVTDNLRDFPTAALAPHNLEALSADKFLANLFDLKPDRVIAILTEQGADLHPPQDLSSMLNKLQRQTPIFVRAVRQHLAQQFPC